VAGLISLRQNWRFIYYIGAGMLAVIVLLLALSMPETAFNRLPNPDDGELADAKNAETIDHVENVPEVPPKMSWRESLSIFSAPRTDESVLLIFFRPVAMLVIAPVAWATLVLGVNVGFMVVMSTSVASSFSTVYNFQTWQVGLVWLSNIVGSLLAIPFAGTLSDYIANMFTRRNNGIREPEMRLPTMVIGMILMPTSILMYGLGLNYQLHYMVPIVALGICQYYPPQRDMSRFLSPGS